MSYNNVTGQLSVAMKKILIFVFILLGVIILLASFRETGSSDSAEAAWGRSGLIKIQMKNNHTITCHGFLVNGGLVRTAKHCFQIAGMASAQFIKNGAPADKREIIIPLNLGSIISSMRDAPDNDVIDVALKSHFSDIKDYEREKNPPGRTTFYYFDKVDGVIVENSCIITIKKRFGTSRRCYFAKGYSGMPVFYANNGIYRFAGIYNGFFDRKNTELSEGTHGFYSIVY